jgi:hypothetical protein
MKSYPLNCWYASLELLTPYPTPILKDRTLSVVCDGLIGVFVATLYIWRPFPPSETWGCATPWWHGTHLTWRASLPPKHIRHVAQIFNPLHPTNVFNSYTILTSSQRFVFGSCRLVCSILVLIKMIYIQGSSVLDPAFRLSGVNTTHKFGGLYIRCM